MKNSAKNVLLIILDGWGISNEKKGNPTILAKTPNIDYYTKNYSSTKLYSHGRNVGLPGNQDGNSEAGHLNIGAGRRVLQDSFFISDSIKSKTFFKNTAFIEAIKHAKKYKTKMHLIGLLSGNESPHMSPSHLYALMELAKKEKISPVVLHLFTDGRDSSQHGAIKFLKNLEKNFKNDEVVASIIGRVYAMDRKKKWENIEKTYNLIVCGEGEKAQSAKDAIRQAYNKKLTDEFITPYIIAKNGKPAETVNDNDVVMFFNLRSDRARELTKAFTQENFNEMNQGSFKRKKIPKNIRFVAMTDFGPDLPNVLTAYPSRNIKNTLPFALKGFSQLYVSETEKYAHVTYFFNGGYSELVANEERIHIPSPNANNYVDVPEMSLPAVAKILKEKIKLKKYNFICVNFNNPDMIGHTGNLKAGIKCCEIVDKYLGDVMSLALKNNFNSIITADHGNIEEMINLKTNEIDTKHSKNLVPFILVGDNFKNRKINFKEGMLCNIAPTILKLMKIKKPKEMTSESLI